MVVCDGSRSGLILQGRNGVIGSTLARIDTPSVVQDYVELFFKQGYVKLNSSMKGAAIPHLDTKELRAGVMGLPPELEQTRIVSKVNELMALCDQLEQQTETSLTAHKTLVETLLGALTNAAENDSFQAAWQRIAEHFDILFTTEHSISQLKQTILQLAVMGKLLPQDPSDEPASVLLEKIAAEKAQLIKDKKIKKQKPLLVIGDEEKPLEIPGSWEWCRVSIVMDNERDISYGVIKLEKEPTIGGIPTLRCSDVKPGRIDLKGVRNVAPEIEEPYKRTRLKGGEVLVNIRGTLGGVALVPKELKGFNVAREVAMLPIHRDVLGLYIVNVVLSPFFWGLIEANLKGIAYKGLSLGLLSNFAIPIPPFEEQLRIVEKVNALMSLCDIMLELIKAAQTTQLNLTDTIAEQAVG